MKFTNLKRITIEDFSEENRADFTKLGNIWNVFLDQFTQLVNNGVDFNNLSQQIKSVTFTTGTDGQPLGGLTIKSTLSSNINGIVVISLKPANVQTVITQAPFINFSENNKIVSITHISGLQNETKYTMTLLLI